MWSEKHLQVALPLRSRLLLTACTAVLIAGCAPADHRISLAAFLACERAFDSGPGPASRPADETDSLHRRLQAQLSPYPKLRSSVRK